MAEICVHQLLHGYRRGHERLAASTSLSSADEELVTRLSDLSGTLTDESRFTPYLTIYPLPSGDYYAVAKTWLDHDAPRAGCVLTHTLLVPMPGWSSLFEPADVAGLLSVPVGSDRARYEKELTLLPSSRAIRSPSSSVIAESATHFVSLFFEQGVRPIVWFGEADPEAILWRLVRAFWPQLRANFACCTLAFQPRHLDQRPFDLMFAPDDAYSRFHKFSPEHFLTPSSSGVTDRRSDRDEPWCDAWTRSVFQSDTQERFESVFSRVAAQLDSDPTAIRKVFLLKNLEDRALNSPRATVGMLDVVETIAPDSHSVLDYKQDLVLRAIRGLEGVGDATDAIQCLRLISERLAQPSFKQISSSVSAQMIAATADRTLQEPELALQLCEAFFYQDADADAPAQAFVRGVLIGLARLASAAPSKLGVLHHFPNAAPAVIAREPVIAASYVRAIGRDGVGTDAVSDLISWINALDEPNARNKLREALLPELKDDQHAAIIAALLRDIPSGKIPIVLDILYHSTRGFKPEGVRRVVEEYISHAHPADVCDWARTSAWRSNGAASVIAASYPSSREGLRELLSNRIEGGRRQSQVVANFLRQAAAQTQYPDWFQDEARKPGVPRPVAWRRQADNN